MLNKLSRPARISTLLKLLSLLLLLFSFLKPLMMDHEKLDHLSILVDRSDSITDSQKSAQASLIQSLYKQVETTGSVTLKIFSEHTSTIYEEQNVSSIHEATESVLLNQMNMPSLNFGVTNLRQVLKSSFHHHNIEEPGAAVILLSDLQENQAIAEPLISTFSDLNIPLYWITPKIIQRPVITIHTPDQITSPSRIVAEVSISSPTPIDAIVRVYLDGQILFEKKQQLLDQQPLNFKQPLLIDTTGIHRIAVTLHDPGQPGQPLSQSTRLITLLAPLKTLLVSSKENASVILQALNKKQQGINLIEPSELHTGTNWNQYNSVILNNISLNEVPITAWQMLIAQVETRGLGLLVIGGDQSFARGGYRNSILEKILPVTAQPTETQKSHRIIFVIDRSGSMARKIDGVTILDRAQTAVTNTLSRLQQKDQFAIIAFDREAELITKMKPVSAQSNTLPPNFEMHAGGGTSLKSAFELAIPEFPKPDNRDNKTKNILIIVTDGSIKQQEIPVLAEQLKENHIDLIAFSVDDKTENTNLQRLAELSNGKMIHSTSAIQLSSQMNDEMNQRVQPYNRQPTATHSQQSLPIIASSETPFQWPVSMGYSITRAKDSASQYLISDKNEPILISHHAGAGRVTVLTTELTTANYLWAQWPGLGSFIQSLLDWSQRHYSSDKLSSRLVRKDGHYQLEIEATDETGGWLTTPALKGLLTAPEGNLLKLDIPMIYPGMYRVRLPITETGEYHFSIQSHLNTLSQTIYLDNNLEYSIRPGNADKIKRWVQNGWITPIQYPDDAHKILAHDSSQIFDRNAVSAAMFLYFLSIVILAMSHLWPFKNNE